MQKVEHQQPRKKSCQFCKRKINLSHYQLHFIMCQEKKQKEDKKVAQLAKTKYQQFKNSKRPLIRKQELKKESIQPKPTKVQRIEQKFACQLCGYQQTLSDLDRHPIRCPNRQVACTYCHKKFPKNILDEHVKVCTSALSNRIPSSSNTLPNQSRTSNQLSSHQTSNTSVNRIPNRIQSEVLSQVQSQSKHQLENLMRHAVLTSKLVCYVIQNSIQMTQQEKNFLLIGLVPSRIMAVIQTRELANRSLSEKGEKMAQQYIKLIPEKRFVMEEDHCDCCSICCVEFQEDDILKDLKCKHDFHTKCISNWLSINSSCPLCKTDLSVNVRKKDVELNKTDQKTKPIAVSKAPRLIDILNAQDQL